MVLLGKAQQCIQQETLFKLLKKMVVSTMVLLKILNNGKGHYINRVYLVY